MIIITAATRWEAGPLRSRLEGKHGVVIVDTGIGPENARRRLEGLGELPPRKSLAISSGLAGALQPGIRSGDLVADLRGAPVEYVQAARETAEKLGIALHMGPFYSVDRVLAEPAQKRAAGQSQRAVAVDMESAAVRSWCENLEGTFLGLRAIVDSVDQRLPWGIYEGDGSALDLARYAVRHWAELPLLISIGIRQRRAMRRLVNFMDEFLTKIDVPGGRAR